MRAKSNNANVQDSQNVGPSEPGVAGHAGATPVDSARSWSAREKVLALVAALCAVVAIVCFALFMTGRVPAGAGAKVNDEYLEESDIAAYIQQYRAGNALTSDEDFASMLYSSGYNVSSFRASCINQLALNMMTDARAKELGCEPTDEEVDAELSSTKEALSMGSDDIWQQTLKDQGMSEDGIRAQLYSKLARQNVFEKDVARREAGDDETLAYAKQAKAGQTMRHSYRLYFTGEDQWDRAQDAYKQLQKMGKVSTASFSELAKAVSDDENAAEDGGSYGWSDATDMAEDYADILNKLDEGDYSEPQSLEEDNAAVIVFCDTVFEFPAAGKIDQLKKKDIPDELWSYLADEAADSLWTEDCNAYLAKLISGASITYYPVPADAAYNVDISLAASADSSGNTDDGSAGSASDSGE